MTARQDISTPTKAIKTLYRYVIAEVTTSLIAGAGLPLTANALNDYDLSWGAAFALASVCTTGASFFLHRNNKDNIQNIPHHAFHGTSEIKSKQSATKYLLRLNFSAATMGITATIAIMNVFYNAQAAVLVPTILMGIGALAVGNHSLDRLEYRLDQFRPRNQPIPFWPR